jgi:hypothetical protein
MKDLTLLRNYREKFFTEIPADLFCTNGEIVDNSSKGRKQNEYVQGLPAFLYTKDISPAHFMQ